MPVTVAQAQAIMQAVTVDVWNNTSKTERAKLLEQYCSPTIKAYAPDGSETTGIEEVRPTLSHIGQLDTNSQDSATATTTSSTPTGDKTGRSRALETSG